MNRFKKSQARLYGIFRKNLRSVMLKAQSAFNITLEALRQLFLTDEFSSVRKSCLANTVFCA